MQRVHLLRKENMQDTVLQGFGKHLFELVKEDIMTTVFMSLHFLPLVGITVFGKIVYKNERSASLKLALLFCLANLGLINVKVNK